MTDTFKYDVAFSFSADKEDIAEKLYSLLKDRINCFIYFDQQKELAGSDGEAKFNSVFQSEARLVVIILSKTWGQTKWTKIEETAIRNRGFENGYDFAIVIPADKDVSIPVWLPKNRIWINIERWNLESAAISIETRVIEFNGQIKTEGTIQKAKRLQSELEKTNSKKAVINSVEGVNIFNSEVERINVYAREKVEEFKKELPEWNLHILRHNDGGVLIRSYNHCLIFSPIPYATNTAEGAQIRIQVWRGLFDLYLVKTDHFFTYNLIEKNEYTFFINNFDEVCWKDKQIDKLHYSEKVFDDFFDILISNVSKEKKN